MSREGPSIGVQISVWTIIIAGSLFVAIVLFELMMQSARQGTVAMRVAPGSYGVFDESLGVRYEPGTTVSFAYLDAKGRVLECLPNISRTNADGFRGLDGRQDYGTAARRVLVSGDSFSHWNNDGMTLVDYTRSTLERGGIDAALLNVAGGTFGLEHMVVHLAAAIEATPESAPDLIAIQFIRDDITRGWWYRQTLTDNAGRPRTRLASDAACLAADSDCGSDEYLIDPRATQAWCESRKGTDTVDDVSQDLVDTYDELRGFFVYVGRALARLGVTERQSVIPRVRDIAQTDTARIERAIATIKASGASVVFVYLPTSDEIASQQVYTFNPVETAVLDYYEAALGVTVTYPESYVAFEGVTEYAVSPYDSHPSGSLQQAYGRYLAALFADRLQ